MQNYKTVFEYIIKEKQQSLNNLHPFSINPNVTWEILEYVLVFICDCLQRNGLQKRFLLHVVKD